jgi:hypothetical protein
MKISSLLSLVAAATLVSAAPLYPLEPRSDSIDSNLDPDVVPGAFIIEVCVCLDHCWLRVDQWADQ